MKTFKLKTPGDTFEGKLVQITDEYLHFERNGERFLIRPLVCLTNLKREQALDRTWKLHFNGWLVSDKTGYKYKNITVSEVLQ